jgi:hypothetical protein
MTTNFVIETGDQTGAGRSNKRSRTEPRYYQPGDSCIASTYEYQSNLTERRQSGEASELTLRAQNYLPMTWKILHGKGKHTGMQVYTNPEGKPYILDKRPVEGCDFFTSPQEAVVYMFNVSFKKHALALDIEKLRDTAAEVERYIKDQQTDKQVNGPKFAATSSSSSCGCSRAAESPTHTPAATIDLQSPSRRLDLQQPFSTVTHNSAGVSVKDDQEEESDSSGDLVSLSSTDNSRA